MTKLTQAQIEIELEAYKIWVKEDDPGDIVFRVNQMQIALNEIDRLKAQLATVNAKLEEYLARTFNERWLNLKHEATIERCAKLAETFEGGEYGIAQAIRELKDKP